MATTKPIIIKQYNGTDYDTLLPENALIGTTAPTTSTVGFVGQIYLNTTSGGVYICTVASGTTYTWETITTIIVGTTAPTTSTAGYVGQLYLNTTTNLLYICTTATTVYTWSQPITFNYLMSLLSNTSVNTSDKIPVYYNNITYYITVAQLESTINAYLSSYYAPLYTYSTTDLTAGSSSLTTGKLYFVYT
jgi:hypothetical protein